MERNAAFSAEEVKTLETNTFDEQTLSSRELASSRELGGGGNVTRFITLRDDGSAVFKPKKGEKLQRSRIEPGTYYKRERAAFLVDKFIGLGLVPPTVIREIDGEVGSAQQFIPDAATAMNEWRPDLAPDPDDPEAASMQSQIATLALFDYLIFNSDRHFGNALVKENRLHAIDHGLAFGDAYYRNEALLDMRDPAWLSGKPIPEETRARFRNFIDSGESRRILHDLLAELLSEKEVDAFFKRLAKVSMLIEKGFFPSRDTVASELTFDGSPQVPQPRY